MHGLIYIINKKGCTFNEICTAENTYHKEWKRGLRTACYESRTSFKMRMFPAAFSAAPSGSAVQEIDRDLRVNHRSVQKRALVDLVVAAVLRPDRVTVSIAHTDESHDARYDLLVLGEILRDRGGLHVPEQRISADLYGRRRGAHP